MFRHAVKTFIGLTQLPVSTYNDTGRYVEAAEHIVDTICTFSSSWQRPCSALWLTILSHMLSQIKISKAKQIAACRRLANFVRRPNIMSREECDSFVPSPILWFVMCILGDECSDDLHVQSDAIVDGLNSLQQVWRWDRCYVVKLALIEWVITNTHISCKKRQWDSTSWPLDYEAYIVWRS